MDGKTQPIAAQQKNSEIYIPLDVAENIFH